MANARNKAVDKTYLSLDTAEERGFIHRDYIAHCMRWSHVIKRLNERKGWATARLLDVGCGRELPLAKTLYSSRYIVEQYYGVDAGPIEDAAMKVFEGHKFPLKVWENCDLMQMEQSDFDDRAINWMTMFEVAEHVEPAHLVAMLRKMNTFCSTDATFFVSTPCWNRTDCAANHVNEMTYECFGAVLEGCGWKIDAVYGTFASIRDYEHLLHKLDPPLNKVFNELREYYDTNFLSCVFAPLFPAQSRNCLWECSYVEEPNYRKFPHISDCQRPWGSSTKWQDFEKELA